MEEGVVGFEPLTIGRLIDDEVVLEWEHQASLANVKTGAEQASFLDQIWADLPPNLREGWQTRERFDYELGLSFARSRMIVGAWDVASKVLII